MISLKNAFSFAFFSGSKSIVFFTPLAILWLLGDAQYVLVEQTFATALLLWPIAALGMTSAYSYFFLEKNDTKFIGYYYRHLMIVLCCLIVIIVILYIVARLNSSVAWLYTAYIVFLMCFSYFLSAIHKCNNDVIRSSSLDSLPYLLFFLFLVGTYYQNQLGTILLIGTLGFSLLYVLHLSKKNGLTFVETKGSQVTLTRKDIKHYFSKGFYSFTVGWFAIAVVMFPRVFVADYTNLDESKALYLALRFGTFFVLIYQFLQIKLYSRIFKISSSTMKKVLLAYWAGLFVILLILMLFNTPLAYYFATLYTGLWIMVSILELQVIRFSVQLQVVKGALLISPILLLLLAVEGFYQFVAFTLVILVAYLFIQAHSVYKMKYAIQVMIIPIISTIGLLYYA